MISLEFNLADMRPDQAPAMAGGTLDPESVHFQFICTTEGGGHDPEAEPDDRVRDSHKALHGTVWRIDDPTAPIPPINFGCRCGMRYCGAPGSVEAVVLGADAPTPPTTVPVAFADWLNVRLPTWRTYADLAKEQSKPDRLGAVYIALKESGVSGDLRELARMIVSAGDAR